MQLWWQPVGTVIVRLHVYNGTARRSADVGGHVFYKNISTAATTFME